MLPVESKLRQTAVYHSTRLFATKNPDAMSGFFGSGGGIRTLNLQVMGLASCHCSTPRRCKPPLGFPTSNAWADPELVEGEVKRLTLRRNLATGAAFGLFVRKRSLKPSLDVVPGVGIEPTT